MDTECEKCRMELIDRFTAIRAIGDLLTAAADSVGQGRSELHGETLASIGVHLEDMATEALVILKYERPRIKPDLQPAAERGAPRSTPAAADDWELDPETKENILKDLENLQDMGSKIQLAAECMCTDLGLEFPPNIQAHIDQSHK